EPDEVVVARELLGPALLFVRVDDGVEAAAAGVEREQPRPRRDEAELEVGREPKPAAAGEAVDAVFGVAEDHVREHVAVPGVVPAAIGIVERELAVTITVAVTGIAITIAITI